MSTSYLCGRPEAVVLGVLCHAFHTLISYSNIDIQLL